MSTLTTPTTTPTLTSLYEVGQQIKTEIVEKRDGIHFSRTLTKNSFLAIEPDSCNSVLNSIVKASCYRVSLLSHFLDTFNCVVHPFFYKNLFIRTLRLTLTKLLRTY